MKCHYEVLSVPRDADDGTIKSAYKKLALKWHPDKNLNNAEEAKEQFQFVQQAYEVLSDRQERAWYDNHREQILRGAGSEFQDNSLDIFQYFTTSCFKGYGDEEKGFYTTYRKVFENIAKEELEFIEDKDEFCEIPSFGDSKSDYETTVRPFYAYWLSYSTKKSYTWLDPYDIRETRDRRVVKLIEKENKKVRQKAKKERNDEIRNLVAFVRKRDKRIQAQTKLEESRKLANRKKQEEISNKKRLERNKQLNASTEQPEWAKFDNVKSELEEIERHLAEEFGEDLSNSEEEFEEVDDNLYCVACNKLFKTVKAFENHETSKKHKENVVNLKEIMLEENEEYSLSQESDISSNCEINGVKDDEECSFGDSEKSYEESDISIGEPEQKIITEKNVNVTLQEEENIMYEESEESIEEIKQIKKNKKQKNILKSTFSEEQVEPDSLLNKLSTDDDDFDFSSSNKQKKKSKKSNKNIKAKKVTHCEPLSDCTPLVEIVKENKSNTSSKSKIEKKQKQVQEISEEVDTKHCCVTCNSTFVSKNKLFNHLKKTGHSVYLPDKSGSSKHRTKK